MNGGRPGVLHGNRTYLLQDGDGQILEGHSISAGLDYPGVGPEHSWLRDTGRVSYVPATDREALDAFQLLTRIEGIIPALEPAHALAHVIKLAPTMAQGPDHRHESLRPRRQGRLRGRRPSRHGHRLMLEVHVNFGSAEEASTVARQAVEKRLAASANIHAPIRSFYWWEQEVRSEEEVPVVFKTSEGKVHDLMDFLARSHSYDTPGHHRAPADDGEQRSTSPGSTARRGRRREAEGMAHG